jgi:hypothetical protein
MARKTDRYDYAPDSYQPASNALGCPFTVMQALSALALLVVGVWLMLAAMSCAPLPMVGMEVEPTETWQCQKIGYSTWRCLDTEAQVVCYLAQGRGWAIDCMPLSQTALEH